jgi:hypothetical protein
MRDTNRNSDDQRMPIWVAGTLRVLIDDFVSASPSVG